MNQQRMTCPKCFGSRPRPSCPLDPEDAGRPIIFYASSGSCWQPAVKGLTMMVNTIFSSYRFEDVWLDK
jgi:hypothetical protein